MALCSLTARIDSLALEVTMAKLLAITALGMVPAPSSHKRLGFSTSQSLCRAHEYLGNYYSWETDCPGGH
jgi:hypothetical protein